MKADPYRYSARWYDRLFERINGGLRVLGLRLFMPREGMAILDVGCGTGQHLQMYRKFGCELHGIDTSPAMLEVARATLGEEADLRLVDAAQMPYESGTFDLVMAMLALHEMDPATRACALQEMKRVVRSAGRILLIDFHPGPIDLREAWSAKLIITLSELAAGGDHYRNYRHFLWSRGLPALIAEHQLVIRKQRIVAGGALAAFLVSTS